MQRMTLAGLPISPATRETLLNSAGVAGALISYGPEPDQDVRVHVFGPALHLRDLKHAKAQVPNAEIVWERSVPTEYIDAKGRTAVAMHALDEDPHLTPYAAAKLAGLNVSAVYRALARREAKAKAPKCACCGRPLAALQEVAA